MGIEEGICWDEHWVLYVNEESWESTPKTKSILCTLYVSQADNKLYLQKKKKKFFLFFFAFLFSVYLSGSPPSPLADRKPLG